MPSEWGVPVTPTWDDGGEDLRDWRWRSYLDHLEDLGYELGTGRRVDETNGGRLDTRTTHGIDATASSRLR